MSIAEIHPEELFDKLVCGSLSESERERLAQHVQVCAVCRFDYEARLDFQHETQTAQPRVAPDLPLQPLRSRPLPTSRRRRSRILVWGMAAALLVGVSGAFAAAAGKPAWRGFLGTLMGESPPAPAVKTAAVAPPAKAAPEAVALAATPAPVLLGQAPAQTQTTATTPPGASQPLAPAPLVAKAAEAPASNVLGKVPSPGVVAKASALAPTTKASASTTKASASTTKASADAAPVPESASAAKLFAEANQARRAGELGRASGLYHVLQEQYPGSSEAELSRVTLATLLLNGGDASGALQGFERYLAGSSRALEAEALVGRARALQRLGRRQLETAAWREVQSRCPGSVYARQAAERLAVLVPP